ncbi:MAG: hypothetical protein Q7R95_02290, partial [bacterium]|nr:hypothetical protein [bacterium]
MSNTVQSYLNTNPTITKYTQLGLININSLARYIKENVKEIDKNDTIASIGMNIRRYMLQLPRLSKSHIGSSNDKLHVITRTNLEELIFNKNNINRKTCLNLFNVISKTTYFSCLIEGEKEMVLLTDYPLKEKLPKIHNSKLISYHTTGLGYISIDFSIKLREVVGIYGCITSALASALISIHS